MLESLSILDGPERPSSGTPLRFPLRLRRAWQRGVWRLALQYVDADGRIVPGRWFADREKAIEAFERLDRATGRAVLAGSAAGPVVLHPDGADDRLPALAGLLEKPGARLLTHRPGRRAVVCLDGGARYAKVLRPSKAGRIMRAFQYVEGLPGRAFGVAETILADEVIGLIVTRALPGTSLHDLAGTDGRAFVESCGRAGRALRSLHVAAPDWLGVHDAGAEAALLRERVEGIGVFVPGLHDAVSSACARVCASLEAAGGGHVVLHRDFYDKQIVIDECGELGLLDFDTLGAGEAALDLANMLAHIELRVMQGACTRATASAAAGAFVDAYAPNGETRRRIPAYLDAARLRLAMLYAYRPKWAGLTPVLLGAVGEPAVWERPERDAPVVSVPKSGRVRPDAHLGDAPCPLVFVVGCPRSGTTMLERMLDAHRDLAMAHETHWITKHTRRGRDLTHMGHVRPETLDALYADRRFVRMAPPREDIERLMARRPMKYRRFVRVVFDHYRRSRGKAYVGDKSTGGYLRNLERLHKVCPDSKIVHLVRDGRDVCLSMLGWPKAGRAAGRFAMFRDDPVATTAAWWRWHVLAGMEQGRRLGEGQYTEVRYEKLVREPGCECDALCARLGLEPDDAMAKFHAGRSKPGAGRSANAAWLAPTPGLRNWRIQMTDEQIEMFEAIAGDALGSLGYERCFARISPSVAGIAAERMDQWVREIGVGASVPIRRNANTATGIPILEGDSK